MDALLDFSCSTGAVTTGVEVSFDCGVSLSKGTSRFLEDIPLDDSGFGVDVSTILIEDRLLSIFDWAAWFGLMDGSSTLAAGFVDVDASSKAAIAGAANCSVGATAGEAAAGLAGSLGLEATLSPTAAATAALGVDSSVLEGVAALTGLLLFRGVCLVRGDEIFGDSAALVVVGKGALSVVSTESVAVGLILAGGMLGEEGFRGNFCGAAGVAGCFRGVEGGGETIDFGWLGDGDASKDGIGCGPVVFTGVFVAIAALDWIGLASAGIAT